MVDDAIFAYVDGIPTKGCWIGVNENTSWADIAKTLEFAGYHAPDEILVACADGLAAKFLSPYDSFDLEGYRDCAAAEGDTDAKHAFLNYESEWDAERFEDTYVQPADTEVEFAQDWFDEIHGETIAQAEQAGLQIDWDSTAFALFVNDFYFSDGHVFRRA